MGSSTLIVGHAQVAHSADADGGEARQGLAAYAWNHGNRQRIETGLIVLGPDDRQRIRFIEIRGDFRYQFVFGDADRGRQPGLIQYSLLDGHSDLCRCAEQGLARGDVEKSLIERQAFDYGRELAKDGEDLPGYGLVVRHARLDAAELGAASDRFSHWHRRADAEGPRLVAGRCNDTAVGAPAYDNRLASQPRVIALLDRRIISVHINVQYAARCWLHLFIGPVRR